MNKFRIITAIIALSLLTGCGASEIPQNTESQTDTKITESENITQDRNTAETPTVDVTAPFVEKYEHMSLQQQPYQTPDLSEVSDYFVHDKLGSALDMDIYIELIDKETDGLYCTVKNNKNVWREVVVKAYTEYDTDVDISAAESFAIATMDEVVVKLTLIVKEYDKIDSLGFSFFCNGMNYSASEQTANIREKEDEKDLSFVLWLYYVHEAALHGAADESKIVLSENIVRGFTTSFFNCDSDTD